MILRDRDIPEAAWTDEAYGKRNERRYYCQNWRADVSAILTDEGSMVEWVKYSAYGVAFGLPAGDTDSDGDYDITDRTRIANGGAYDVRKDVDLDGTIKAADITAANAVTGGYHALGRGVLSAGGPGGAVGNRRGYAGYEYAPELEGTGAAGRHLYHVRNRVYDADVGRWTRRDPLGYVDGMGLYEYVGGMAVVTVDPHGNKAISYSGVSHDTIICRNTGKCGEQYAIDIINYLAPAACDVPFHSMEVMSTDSLTQALKACMKQKNKCLRYECILDILETFNVVSGGKLQDWVDRVRTLKTLWCLRGRPSDVDDTWCGLQYDIIKPLCDSCGTCRGSGPYTDEDCERFTKSMLCFIACKGLYEHFDAVCSKGAGGKRDPTKHKAKIEGFEKARKNCVDKIEICAKRGNI